MTDVARRAVLGAGVSTLALAALGLAAPADAATTSLPRRADYATSVGRTFTATRNGRSHTVTLAHIRDVAGTKSSYRDRCFNLVFTVAGTRDLAEGIYTVRRLGVPAHALFLSRLGAPRTVQALVNRSV
jgi:Zn-dependent alcohol dehydrogenase